MKKKLSILTTLIITAGLTLTACGNNQTATNQTETSEISQSTETSSTETTSTEITSNEELTVYIDDSTATRLFDVAQNFGIFDEVFGTDNNIKFDLQYLPNGTYAAQALESGDIDFGIFGDQPALAGAANGYHYVIVGKDNDSQQYYPLVAGVNAGISTIQDIKGKKVATILGTTYHYHLLRYLETNGLSIDDIEVINSNDPASLLRSGDVDAIIQVASTAQTLIDEGTAVYVYDGVENNISGLVVYGARTDFANEHSDIVIKLLQVIQKTNEFVKENEETVYKYVAEQAGVSVETARAGYANTNRDVKITENNLSDLDNVLAYLRNQGIISDQNLVPSDIVDLTFLKEAGF